MNNIKVMTNERLNKLITDTQHTLDELRDEVSRREEAQQNREIDGLDVHMETAELSLAKIREFVAMLLSERKKDNNQAS